MLKYLNTFFITLILALSVKAQGIGGGGGFGSWSSFNGATGAITLTLGSPFTLTQTTTGSFLIGNLLTIDGNSGAFIFNGSGVSKVGNTYTFSGSGGGTNIDTQTIAYAATITPSLSALDNHILNVGTLTGNITIAAPIGATPSDGWTLTYRLIQDNIGGRTITWVSSYALTGDITPAAVSTTPNAKTDVKFIWNNVSTKWEASGLNHK